MEENNVAPNTPQSTPIESAPQVPLVEKPKNNIAKLLIIIGIIILLLILGTVGFTYFSQKPPSNTVVPPVEPTATPVSTDLTPDVSDWKTYRNEQYGFEFKYPTDWQYETQADASSWIDSIFTRHYGFGFIDTKNHIGEEVEPFINSRIIFHVAKTKNPKALETVIKNNFSSGSISKRRINNLDFTIVNHGGGIAGGYEVLIQNDNIIIDIDAGLAVIGSSSESAGKGVLDKILSTFKFIDTTNSSSLYDLDTYMAWNFNKNSNMRGNNLYPAEITELSTDQLVKFKCTHDMYKSDDGFSFYDNIQSKHVQVTDPLIIELLSKASTVIDGQSLPSAFVCESEDKQYYIEFEHHDGSGGSLNKAYIGIWSNNTISVLTNIPNDGTAYFGCRKILAITKSGIAYLECGGGDGGTGSTSIYRVDMTSKTHSLLVKCTSIANEDLTDSTVTCN